MIRSKHGGTMNFRSVNPATGGLIREYPGHTPDQVEALLAQAEQAFSDWKRTTFARRGSLLRRAAAVLRGRQRQWAELMTLEMGKPIAGAEAEVEKCALACDYFADNAERLLAREDAQTEATRSYVRYDPLGPVLAIMPWNFPFWQLFRFAAPALMAGNVAVLKHAWNVPGCASALEEIFRDAGYPPGVLTSLLVVNEQAEALIAHRVIRAVTLTGSGRAGKAVGSAAGKALKKSVLELGGSDPFIVLADADVEKTAAAAASARCINSGQSCIAAKRFIVERPIAERFEEALVKRMAAMKVGDPMDRSVEIGPLARLDLLETLEDQVRRSLAAGAELATGGRRVPREGFFHEPTVLLDVRPGNPAFEEETFGPVAAVTRADDVAHAEALANDSQYGLGASIWTNDTALAEKLAAVLNAGCVFVNGIVRSDPRLPFGGVKASGYGRELAQVGIREFVNIKTVWVKDP
jgi:succinate-semialdehyde dehydrogenase/glutarate-semialdehyde dehydrogenase